MSEIIWYLSFSDWLISLSIMFSRSIKRVNFLPFYGTVVFLSINVPSCFIHSSTDWQLGCFHILATENNVAMNIGVLMFFQISVLGFFGYSLISGITGSKDKSIFNFLRYLPMLSRVAALVCIPTNSAKGFPFLYILTSTCLLMY